MKRLTFGVLILISTVTSAETTVYNCSSDRGEVIITETRESVLLDYSNHDIFPLAIRRLGNEISDRVIEYNKPIMVTQKKHRGDSKDIAKNTKKEFKLKKSYAESFSNMQSKFKLKKNKLEATMSWKSGGFPFSSESDSDKLDCFKEVLSNSSNTIKD